MTIKWRLQDSESERELRIIDYKNGECGFDLTGAYGGKTYSTITADVAKQIIEELTKFIESRSK